MIADKDRERLRNMVQFAQEAIGFLGSAGPKQLAADLKSLRAVSYALLAIGEAANRISRETRLAMPAIDWDQVIGMRHHLAHGYDAIRSRVIVETIRDDLPGLIATIQHALEEPLS